MSFQFENPRDVEIPAPEQNDSSRFYNEMERIRNMDTPGITAYKQALGEMPTPDQYKPNWLTRIASGLSGFSAGMKDAGAGIKTAMALNRAPYEQAMEEYTNRLGGLKEQSVLEQADRASRMSAIQKAAELGLKYEDFAAKRGEAEALQRSRDVTAGAAATRAKAYADSLNLPNYEKEPQEDGSLLVWNKKNPADRSIIPAHTVAAGALKVSKQRAATAQEAVGVSRGQLGVAQTNAETNKKAQAATQRNIDSQIQTRASLVGNLQTPAAQKTARELAADELFTDPTWREFLEAGATPDDFTPEAYSLFKEALDNKTNEILSKRKK